MLIAKSVRPVPRKLSTREQLTPQTRLLDNIRIHLGPHSLTQVTPRQTVRVAFPNYPLLLVSEHGRRTAVFLPLLPSFYDLLPLTRLPNLKGRHRAIILIPPTFEPV